MGYLSFRSQISTFENVGTMLASVSFTLCGVLLYQARRLSAAQLFLSPSRSPFCLSTARAVLLSLSLSRPREHARDDSDAQVLLYAAICPCVHFDEVPSDAPDARGYHNSACCCLGEQRDRRTATRCLHCVGDACLLCYVALAVLSLCLWITICVGVEEDVVVFLDSDEDDDEDDEDYTGATDEIHSATDLRRWFAEWAAARVAAYGWFFVSSLLMHFNPFCSCACCCTFVTGKWLRERDAHARLRVRMVNPRYEARHTVMNRATFVCIQTERRVGGRIPPLEARLLRATAPVVNPRAATSPRRARGARGRRLLHLRVHGQSGPTPRGRGRRRRRLLALRRR
jgi:hypothetical protein